MNYGEEYVICPFFKEGTSSTIRCEGLFSVACINNFKDRKAKQRHNEIYCCTFNYKNCLYAKCLLEKNDAEEVAEKEQCYTELYKITQKRGCERD